MRKYFACFAVILTFSNAYADWNLGKQAKDVICQAIADKQCSHQSSLDKLICVSASSFDVDEVIIHRGQTQIQFSFSGKLTGQQIGKTNCSGTLIHHPIEYHVLEINCD